MAKPSKNSDISEKTLMAVLLVLMILLSPISNIWAAIDAPWYSPYLAWAVAIFLSWLLQRHLQQANDK